MNDKKRDPNIDYGFHAVIPRTVRTEYRDVTPIQKWLYVCLKDLCGDNGVCYRTLKVLSEETGISTGMLSESIPILHEAGLIHAEKKRRSNKPTGKEVWHITIVDVWMANGKLHPIKRSQCEPTSENVHNVNQNVHDMNEDAEKRSQGEPKRSQIPHRSNTTGSINNNEERTSEVTETQMPHGTASKGVFSFLASTHMGTQSSEHPAHSSRTSTQKGTLPSRTKKQPELHQFTLTGNACLDALNAARTSPLTPKQVQENATHLEELALMIDTSNGKMLLQGIKTVWDYMGKDAFWCNKRSVPMFCKKFGDLYDVATSPVAPKPSQNGYHKPVEPPSYQDLYDPAHVAALPPPTGKHGDTIKTRNQLRRGVGLPLLEDPDARPVAESPPMPVVPPQPTVVAPQDKPFRPQLEQLERLAAELNRSDLLEIRHDPMLTRVRATEVIFAALGKPVPQHAHVK